MIQEDGLKVFTEWVDGYLNFEKTPVKNIFWLETMKYLLDRLGNPEKSGKSFHVAGSKGKGSISNMISSVLKEAGIRSGVYSSPHILNFSERIGTVDGPLDNSSYLASAKELMSKVNSIIPENLPQQRPITWFELVTAYGMLCFKNEGFDWNVYEVGLGGRLDATNVILPEVCCIGTIELEHTEFLGDTLEKIAFEKGGIIKEGVPVVIAPQKESVKEVFKNICQERHAPCYFVDELCTVEGLNYSFEGKLYSPEPLNNCNAFCKMNFILKSDMFKRPLNISAGLLGEFQALNASVAAIACKIAFPEMDETIIEKGIGNAHLPGRFEIITKVPGYSGIKALVLDGAHTVNSMKFTMDTFQRLIENEDLKELSDVALLFGCASDKDVEHMVHAFAGKFDKYYLTIPGEVKASDFDRALRAFETEKIDVISSRNYSSMIDCVLEDADRCNGVVLVTGSFYLVAEVKKKLLAQRCVN